MKEKVRGAHFTFFDDVRFVSGKYNGEEYTIVDINHGKDSFYDRWLMSRCKHNICVNFTFSFWGYRLNGNEDKIVICPTIHKNSQVFVKEWWKGWIFVSPERKTIAESKTGRVRNEDGKREELFSKIALYSF